MAPSSKAPTKTRGTSSRAFSTSGGLRRTTAACWATACTMCLRPEGTGFRPSARSGATAERANSAPWARRRSARRPRRFSRPLWASRVPLSSRKPCSMSGDPAWAANVLPAPPRAAVRPVLRSAHGLEWTDDYAWIRAENWQEVLRDPSRLPSDIRSHLVAENAYADAVLAPTAALQEELVQEMRARIQEDDREPPQVDGPHAYYSRYRPGGQHRIYCRKPRAGGDETILIDGDALAEGKPFFRLASARHSPDHKKIAWSADDLGSELLTIFMRDVERSADLPDRVVRATDDIVWTRDSTAFLYVEQDENHRPFRVMLHRLGTDQREDAEIFVEADPAWFIGVRATRLGRSALLVVHGHDGAETHVVDLDRPSAKPLLIAPRRPGLFYDVMDHGDGFYIRTNSGARDFKIVFASGEAPREENWRDVVPHREGNFIADATLFRDYLVVLAREDSRPRLTIHDFGNGDTSDIAFEEETYALDFEPVYEFDSRLLRFSYSSMARPKGILDTDFATRA